MTTQPFITAHVQQFKETKSILPLVRAVTLIVRQQRTTELMYGGYCNVVHRPSPVCPCDDEGALSAILDKTSEFAQHRPLSRERLTELYGEDFDVGSLPHDFEEVRCESVWHHKDCLILGEYGEHSRLAYVTPGLCIVSDYYSHVPGVRHIHSIQRYGDSGEFLVSTGDRCKFLDLWAIGQGEVSFVRRWRKRLAGFTAAVEVNGRYFFGSDFSNRPNFIETLGGTKYFFPEKAYNLHVAAFYAFFDRYIVAINTELEISGGRRTLSVFDAVKEEFVFCDNVDL
jgi:hypothetical protein